MTKEERIMKKRLKQLEKEKAKQDIIKAKQKKKSLEVKFPSWYRLAEKKEMKKQLVKKHVEEYATPVNVEGHDTFTPDPKDVKEYTALLNGAKLKDLIKLAGGLKHYKLKLDIGDRLKSIDKKKFAVVTIFNDNKTTDTGVVHCYLRTFSRRGMSYIVMSERGVYDPEFKMLHFYYYANNPYPILYQKVMPPDAVVDGKLMDDTIQMKVIEALAAIDIDKKISIILFCVIINLLISAIRLIMSLRGATT